MPAVSLPFHCTMYTVQVAAMWREASQPAPRATEHHGLARQPRTAAARVGGIPVKLHFDSPPITEMNFR